MFIGDLVKLKNNVIRNNKDKEFVENAIKEDWIWLITGMDDEDVGYIIQPLYLDSDNTSLIQLGDSLMVTYDEIKTVVVVRETLFEILKRQISC